MSDDTTPPPPEGADPTPPPSNPPPSNPPPPPGGYGVPPAPPVPPGYGAPPAGAGGYDAVAAVKYGWATFTKSPSTLLVPALVVILIVAAAQITLQLVFTGIFLSTDDCTVNITDTGIVANDCGGPGFFTSLFVAALVGGIGTFISQILAAGLIRSALNIVDGQPALDVGGVFGWASKPAVIQTAAILGGLSFLGTFVFYVGAIVVSFLTAFAMFFAVDRGTGGVEAIKSSAMFMINNIGNTILFVLLGIAVLIAGALACLVGLFVAIPVLIVAAAYTFRVLHNQPVAPLA